MTGVNPAQLSVLSVLMGGPRTIGDLAATEQVQPPTMSRLIREMEAAGLVFRTRDDQDGRVVWIQWTADGEGVLTAAASCASPRCATRSMRCRPRSGGR